MSRLEQLKAAFAKKTTEVSNNYRQFLRFWKMDVDEHVVVRFLPDPNKDNPRLFLIENLTHELWINGEKKRVPCLTMFGEECPICKKSQEFYKRDGDNSEDGKKYYKKREYIAQVLVKSAPFQLEESDDPVKLVSFGPQIYKIISSGIFSGDLEEDPSDWDAGYDFRIEKTKQGENANYTTSRFVPKQSAVDPDIRAVLDVKDLETYRTKHMPAEVLEQMFNAAHNSGSADTYTNADSGLSDDSATEDQPAESTETVAQTKSTPKVESKPVSGKSTADLLAQIKQRAAANKQ